MITKMKTKMKYNSIKSFEPAVSAVSAVTPAVLPSPLSVVKAKSTSPKVDPKNGNMGSGVTGAFIAGAFITIAIIVLPVIRYYYTNKD